MKVGYVQLVEGKCVKLLKKMYIICHLLILLELQE